MLKSLYAFVIVVLLTILMLEVMFRVFGKCGAASGLFRKSESSERRSSEYEKVNPFEGAGVRATDPDAMFADVPEAQVI